MTADSGQEALANGRKTTSGMSGLCQKYVRDNCWRVPSLYGSAIEAWHGAAQKHAGDRSPPIGAPCYYEGGQYGHAVIYAGGGKIRSTDCTSANDISEVALDWPERNWGYRFLGWTGDLNGIDLPLGGGGSGEEDEDMPLSEDDLSKIAKRVNQVLGDFTASGEPRDLEGGSAGTSDQADTRLRQIETVVRDIQDRVKRLESQS